MKLLHIIPGMDPKKGGVGQAVRTLVAGLKGLQVENEVVCLDDPSDEFLKKDNFQVHATGPGKGPWCYSPQLLPWLEQHLENYDVVIVHGLWLYHGYALHKAMKKLRTKNSNKKGSIPKLFIMPHGMLDPYFQKAEGRKLKAMRNWLYWKLIEGKVVNAADGILFTCEVESLLAREPFSPYKPKKEIIIGLGIEEPLQLTTLMKDAVDKVFPQLKEQRYIIYMGRLDEKKGVDILLQAFDKIYEQGVDKNIKLVIAGPGLETQYGRKLQEYVDSHESIKDIVIFAGMVTGDLKWGLLYNSEVFVLPSHQENFGIAVVEALAIGKPVLISDQVNIWKEIEKEKAGFVNKDTKDGTTILLETWLKLSPAERKLMSENARSCYLKHFAHEPVVKKLVAAIHDQTNHS